MLLTNKMHTKQSFPWHYQTFLFMAINVATTLILYLPQLNSFTHTYKRNRIEWIILLAGVTSDWSPSLICLEGHSKSVINCEIVFQARSLTILRTCHQVENLLSDLLVYFKDLINTQRSKHSTHTIF